MSDFDRLKETLAKLSERERIGGERRRLAGSSAEAMLASVVIEIDETILPRRLSFAVEDGATLHLAVANRRLQAMVSPAPEIVGQDTGELADRPITDVEDDAVAVLKDLVLAVFADAKPVSLIDPEPAPAALDMVQATLGDARQPMMIVGGGSLVIGSHLPPAQRHSRPPWGWGNA